MFQILLSLDNAGVVVISLDVASVEVEVASVTLVVPVVIPRASFSCSLHSLLPDVKMGLFHVTTFVFLTLPEYNEQRV